MNEDQEARYQCVGICMTDPDSGYCLGCGRPPETEPGIVAEAVQPVAGLPTDGQDPDSSG